MGLSFSLEKPLGARADGATKRRVLITGAAGRIGKSFAAHAKDRYQLRLMVREASEAAALEPFGEVVVCELTDLDGLAKACAGMDSIVHLAGDPDPSAVWRDLLEANIIGTYHLMAAAKKARCRRVVYASSIHAVSGYPAEVQVKTSDPVNPGDLYGVTKCFAEALGRYVAEQEGLSVIAIRIGGFQQVADVQNDDGKFPLINAFVSPRDLHQLFERCIDTENVKFAIFNGLSNNPFNRLDLSDARELVGYEPQDDFTALNPELKPLLLHERLIAHNAMEPGRGKSGMREETGK